MRFTFWAYDVQSPGLALSLIEEWMEAHIPKVKGNKAIHIEIRVDGE